MPSGEGKTSENGPKSTQSGHVARKQRKMETRKMTAAAAAIAKAQENSATEAISEIAIQTILKEVPAGGEANIAAKLEAMEERQQVTIQLLITEINTLKQAFKEQQAKQQTEINASEVLQQRNHPDFNGAPPVELNGALCRLK